MILWSAQQLGCGEARSEDLSGGQDYDGVRFRALQASLFVV